MEKDFDEINGQLWEMLPETQIKHVFDNSHASADIGPEFLGFVDIYYYLSKAIPQHFTVIDLGCAYAPQAFFFQDHAAYIGVDMEEGPRFKGTNTTHVVSRIEDFIRNDAPTIARPRFAICSYVPPWGGDNGRTVREYFENIFVFYPEGGERLTLAEP